MNILQSKLASDKAHGKIAKELNMLMQEGRQLGATEGPLRVELICEEYKHLSPNTAYLWLDPGAFQREVEEAQIHTRGIECMHIVRNILSLAPLIATWAALFAAMNSYKDYISLPSSDKGASIMALWQTGFQGRTWLTFTVAAGIDVVLLVLYLVAILLVHELERRASARAVRYTHKLQGKIDELVKCIALEGLTHVGDQADIDKVVDAVKTVVESASSAMKQTVDTTTSLLKQYVDNTTNVLTLHIDKANDATNTIVTRLEKTMQTLTTSTQASIKQVVDASTQAITVSNQRVESLFTQTITPLMTDFHQDMSTLHTELGNYQGRLNDLTNASQQLAGAGAGLVQASQGLVDNAERYITIGQDIGAQIASLNTTQQDSLLQIQTVANGINTAASSMGTATTNMVNATQRVEGIATQLDINTRTTIQKMTQAIDTATRGLLQVGPPLEQTSQQLERVAYQLAAIKIPWLFRRRPAPQPTGSNQQQRRPGV